MPTYTKRPAKDLVITDANPTSNLNLAGIITGVYLGPTIYRGLLHFDLADFPAYSAITAAQLELNCIGAGFLDIEGAVYRLSEPDWVETEATWNNRKAGTPWVTPGGDYDSDIAQTNWFQPSSNGVVPIAGAAMRALVEDALVSRGAQLHLLVRQHDEASLAGTYQWTDREYEDVGGGIYPLLTVTYTTGAQLTPIMEPAASTLAGSRPARAGAPSPPARPASPRRT